MQTASVPSGSKQPLLVWKKGMKSQRLKALGLKDDLLARKEPQDKAGSIQPLYVNLHRRAASSGDRGDTHRYVTCPARDISGSGSTGTCSGSSSESCRSSHTSRTLASCGLSGGRNPVGRWHRGGRGAGGQGDSSVSTCSLGPGWLIIPRNLTEVQLGGEGEPWASWTQAEPLSQERWWEPGAAGECRGQRHSGV